MLSHRRKRLEGGLAILPRQQLDTQLVPESERFNLWASFALGSAPTSIYTPEREGFVASGQVIDLGGIQLASFRYPTLTVKRTAKQIRQVDPEMYQLAWPVAGFSAISQARNGSIVNPKNFTFLDTSRPWEAVHRAEATPSSTICVNIPHEQMPLPAQKVNRLLAAPIPAVHGMGALLSQLLRRVMRAPEEYGQADVQRLRNIVLNLVCETLVSVAPAGGSRRSEMREEVTRMRIREFIEGALTTPNLSPGLVADANGMSLRTLHRLFQAEETTVAEYIRSRRLDKCRLDFLNPLLAGEPIHVIAARWGFRDRSNFGRVFSNRYGMSARDCRSADVPAA
ncbi:helix-turn-helix domain-containing protein (plasmid) [Micromonospora zamorensis]|uniref:AraC-like ligand-binding domain-containing protein n=1 Tax=Micromonospora zamorensis TaxID=709883 RepID=UPI002E24CA95